MNQLPETIADAVNQLSDSIDSGFFVYDLDAFEQHVKQLVDSELTLWYAVKANPLSAVIKTGKFASNFSFIV